MEWVKTTAKTLPEAIDLALDNLGVDESEAEIVILEEPRPGLFGRMRGTARVEARVKPKPIRPKTERNRSRRKGGDGNRSRNRNRRKGGDGERGGRQNDGDGRGEGRGEGRSEGRGGRNGGGQGQGRGGGGGGNRNRNRGRDGGERNGPKDARPAGGGRSGRGERSRERGGGGRDRSAVSGQETNPNEGASVEEVAAHLRTFLTELTEAFGFDSDVVIDDSEEDALIGRIEGRHGLLVGPKGRTLDAVQELARISCQRTVPSSVRIKVDVGGYREQRIAALADFAAKAADKAVADGLEVALEPMTPADRKAVHDALNGDDRVETRSVGSEPRRKVLVVPLASDDAEEDAEEDVDIEDEPAEADELAEVEDAAVEGLADSGDDDEE